MKKKRTGGRTSGRPIDQPRREVVRRVGRVLRGGV